MNLRERLAYTFGLIHEVENKVLDGSLRVQKVCKTLLKLLEGDLLHKWQKEKRYRGWVLTPVFEEYLYLPRDENVAGTIWDKKDEWFSEELTDSEDEVGANILWKLDTLGLIERSPCLEDLRYYLIHDEERKSKWDRSGYAVVAWRDAVVSRYTQHNVLVPVLLYVKGVLEIKWFTLQDIARLKFKILIRRV